MQLDRDDLRTASRRYDSAKYSEAFYLDHLAVLRRATEVDGGLQLTVRNLFLWKLGKIRQRPTPTSRPAELPAGVQGRYYAIGITGAHQAVLRRAVDEGALAKALAFREGRLGFGAFSSVAEGLTHGTIVLPAYYVHIWRPTEYPILDQRVWRACCRALGRGVRTHTKPSTWDDYGTYIRFFEGLVATTGLEPRLVDRGLWVLGEG